MKNKKFFQIAIGILVLAVLSCQAVQSIPVLSGIFPSATPTVTNTPTATSTPTATTTPSPTATRNPTLTPKPKTSTPSIENSIIPLLKGEGFKEDSTWKCTPGETCKAYTNADIVMTAVVYGSGLVEFYLWPQTKAIDTSQTNVLDRLILANWNAEMDNALAKLLQPAFSAPGLRMSSNLGSRFISVIYFKEPTYTEFVFQIGAPGSSE